MYHSLTWGNAESTLIQAVRADGSIHIVEPDQPDLFNLLASGAVMPVADYVPPEPPTDAEILARERAGLVTTIGLLRIAINRAGETGRAEATLLLFPEQSIIWCTGGKVSRQGFVCQALESAFTEAEVDAFFRTAMSITL